MLITSTVVLWNIVYNIYAFLNSMGASSMALTYIFSSIGQVIALLLFQALNKLFQIFSVLILFVW